MSAENPEPTNAATDSKWVAAAFWSVFALCALTYLWVHGLAGLSFPVPWPDESSFLWPAIAVQEHSTLFTPELNPDRHLLWMPPGYAIVMGAIFKVTGFSLAWARMLSAIFLLGGFACLAVAARKLRFPVAAMLVLGGVFLDRYFVLMGNFARMEALLILGIGIAALLLVRGSLLKALAVLLLCPLIHPNGIYLTAAMGLYVAWKIAFRRDELRPSWADAALLAAAVFAWLGYAAYVGQHWAEFLSDMQFQVSWKKQPGPLDAAFWSSWLAPAHLALSVFLLALVACGVALRAPSTRWMVLAFPLHLMPITPGEWYYQVFLGLLFVLVALVVVDLAGRAAERFGPRGRASGAIAATGCLALILCTGFAGGWIESPFGYPRSMQVAGFHIDPPEGYIDLEEERAVRAFLTSLGSASSPVTVMFNPWGEALLFHDLRSERLRFIHPTFYTAEADYSVIHITPLIPDIPGFYNRERLTRRVRDFPRIRVRNQTELWLYESEPEPITHGKLRPPNGSRRKRGGDSG